MNGQKNYVMAIHKQSVEYYEYYKKFEQSELGIKEFCREHKDIKGLEHFIQSLLFYVNSSRKYKDYYLAVEKHLKCNDSNLRPQTILEYCKKNKHVKRSMISKFKNHQKIMKNLEENGFSKEEIYKNHKFLFTKRDDGTMEFNPVFLTEDTKKPERKFTDMEFSPEPKKECILSLTTEQKPLEMVLNGLQIVIPASYGTEKLIKLIEAIRNL